MSTRDMWAALRGVVLATIAVFLVFTLFDVHRAAVPRGIWFIFLLLCLAFVAGSRLLTRTLIERPLPGRIVARGKEAIVVGAGDAAQLVVKEMQRNPALGYTPIGLVDDDPRKRGLRIHGVRVLGTTDDLASILRDRRPDEVLIAAPSATGELRERVVEMCRSLGVGVKTLPGLTELVAGDFDLIRQLRPVEVEDVLGREPVEVDLDAIAGLPRRRDRARHGRGRVDRRRAVPPDRPCRADDAAARRPRRAAAVRDRAGARPRARVHCGRGDRGGREGPGEDGAGLRALPARARLPRCRLQARGDDGGEPHRGGAQQHAGDADARGRRRRVRRQAIRARVDGQGREPAHGDGPVQGAVRVDRRDLGAPRRRRRPASWRSGSATCSARRAR